MFTFRAPLARDILHIADNLRHEDVREVAASHGHSPLQALAYAVTSSTLCRVAFWKRRPVAVFGYARHPEGPVSVWLLGTDTLTAPGVRRAFLCVARRFTDVWADAFGVLFNYVDVRAETSRRWLRWMGFVEQPPMPYGPLSLPFIPVVKTHVQSCRHPNRHCRCGRCHADQRSTPTGQSRCTSVRCAATTNQRSDRRTDGCPDSGSACIACFPARFCG